MEKLDGLERPRGSGDAEEAGRAGIDCRLDGLRKAGRVGGVGGAGRVAKAGGGLFERLETFGGV